MAYTKQQWNQYEKSKTIEENIENDAVVTPSKLNHIEEGFGVLEQDFAASLVAQKEAIDDDIADRDLIINGEITSNKEDAENRIKTVDDKIAVVTKSVTDNKTANDQVNSIQDTRVLKLEDITSIKATNLIENGDFSKSTANWLGYYGAISAQSNVLTYTLNDTTNLISTRIDTAQSIQWKKDHSYYVSGYLKTPKISTGKIQIGNIPIAFSINKIDEWQKMTAIAKPTTDTNVPFRFYVTATNYIIGESWQYRNIISLDLTETFGVGNEPTQSQMDRLLAQFPNSWFDGTQNLFNARAALAEMRDLDNKKANAKQSDWVKPAMLNGWVSVESSPVQYMLDSLGFVHITGRASGGTIGATTPMFIIPVGLRPYFSNTYSVVTGGGVFAMITVSNNGFVYANNGNNSYITLDTPPFKGER